MPTSVPGDLGQPRPRPAGATTQVQQPPPGAAAPQGLRTAPAVPNPWTGVADSRAQGCSTARDDAGARDHGSTGCPGAGQGREPVQALGCALATLVRAGTALGCCMLGGPQKRLPAPCHRDRSKTHRGGQLDTGEQLLHGPEPGNGFHPGRTNGTLQAGPGEASQGTSASLPSPCPSWCARQRMPQAEGKK